jgi:hypothetical protein
MLNAKFVIYTDVLIACRVLRIAMVTTESRNSRQSTCLSTTNATIINSHLIKAIDSRLEFVADATQCSNAAVAVSVAAVAAAATMRQCAVTVVGGIPHQMSNVPVIADQIKFPLTVLLDNIYLLKINDNWNQQSITIIYISSRNLYLLSKYYTNPLSIFLLMIVALFKFFREKIE